MVKKKEQEEKKKDPYSLKEIFEEMELNLIKSMKQALSFHRREEIKEGFSWEQWQRSKLRSIEEYRKRNKEIIGSYSSDVENTIKEVLQTGFDKGSNENNSIIDMPTDQTKGSISEVPPNDNQFFGMNDKKLKALQSSSTNDFEKSQDAVFRKMNDVYREVIYKTSTMMTSGSMSLTKAIDIATEDFLKRGINCIKYKDGKRVNIVTYAEMALRTASQRATFLGQGKWRDENGHHLVFVSAHANCCEMCLPWQGKVLIDDVFSHPSDEFLKQNSNFELLSVAIKSGLLHPNCRHTIATFFPGKTSLPTITDNETVRKNYQAEQKQRKLENAIRQAKRLYEGATDEENKNKRSEYVRKLHKEMRDHIKNNPQLRRAYEREKVINAKDTLSSKLENFDESSLQSLSEDTIIEIDRSLTKFYKEYPEMKGIVSGVHLTTGGLATAELAIQKEGISISLGINSKLTRNYAKETAERHFRNYKWTKKPGIEGIIRHEMGHAMNYDYYVRKNGLKYNTSYPEAPLQKLIDDLETNNFAIDIKHEVFKRLGVKEDLKNVEKYFSSYASKIGVMPEAEFFAEAFSDYSDTEAKKIFFEVLKERMK